MLLLNSRASPREPNGVVATWAAHDNASGDLEIHVTRLERRPDRVEETSVWVGGPARDDRQH
jgi:hypothetical protein